MTNQNTTPITPDSLFDNCSETLMLLLSYIALKFKNSLSAAMVGHIVTSIVTGTTSMLQLSLGLLVSEKKLWKDYTIRFKVTAAASSNKLGSNLNLNANDGLIQFVAENFDAQICSQNGLQQTHGLASIVTQCSSVNEERSEKQIVKRLTKDLATLK